MELSGAISLFLAIYTIILLILKVMRDYSQRKTLPPGPTPLPFLGNIMQINSKELLKSLLKLHEKYGPVFTVHFGPRPVVVLCGHQAVKEALVDKAEEFSGRVTNATVDDTFQGYGEITQLGLQYFTELSLNREASPVRWSCHDMAAKYDLSEDSDSPRSDREPRLSWPFWRYQDAIHLRRLEEFRKTNGKAFNPTFYLSRAVSNVVSTILFGSRFDYEDKVFQMLTQTSNDIFRLMSTPSGQKYDVYYSFLKYFRGTQTKINELLRQILVVIAEHVKMNQETLDLNNPRNYIDCFLIQKEKEKDNPDSEFTIRNLELSVLILLFAGTETVSSTLRFAFLYLMKYPEVQGMKKLG
nr:cytochrome P450 2G1-like [Anolis sagrei ordinatus]